MASKAGDPQNMASKAGDPQNKRASGSSIPEAKRHKESSNTGDDEFEFDAHILKSIRDQCVNRTQDFLNLSTSQIKQMAQGITKTFNDANSSKHEVSETKRKIDKIRKEKMESRADPAYLRVPRIVHNEAQAIAFEAIDDMIVHKYVFEEMDLKQLCLTSGYVPVPCEQTLPNCPCSLIEALSQLQGHFWFVGPNGRLERGVSTIESVKMKYDGAVVESEQAPDHELEELLLKMQKTGEEKWNRIHELFKKLPDAAQQEKVLEELLPRIAGRLQATATSLLAGGRKTIDDLVYFNQLKGATDHKELGDKCQRYLPATLRKICALRTAPEVCTADKTLVSVTQGQYSWDQWKKPQAFQQRVADYDAQIQAAAENAAKMTTQVNSLRDTYMKKNHELQRKEEQFKEKKRSLEERKRKASKDDEELHKLQVAVDTCAEELEELRSETLAARGVYQETLEFKRSQTSIAVQIGKQKLAQAKDMAANALKKIADQNHEASWQTRDPSKGVPLGVYKRFLGEADMSEAMSHKQTSSSQSYSASVGVSVGAFGGSASVGATHEKSQSNTEVVATAESQTTLINFEGETFMLANPALKEIETLFGQKDYYIPGIQAGELWNADKFQVQYVLDRIVVCQKLAVHCASDKVRATIAEESESTASSLDVSASVSVPFVSASASYSSKAASDQAHAEADADAKMDEKTILKPNPHIKFLLFRPVGGAAPLRDSEGRGITAESMNCRKYIVCDPDSMIAANKKSEAERQERMKARKAELEKAKAK